MQKVSSVVHQDKSSKSKFAALQVYEKVVDTYTNITTYTLPIINYTQDHPYFLKHIITEKDGVEKAGFLKIIPDNYTASSSLSWNNFSGTVQMYSHKMTLVSQSRYVNGVVQASQPSAGTFARTSSQCWNQTDIIVHTCSNGGYHLPGEVCDLGTNDAYYEIRTTVKCGVFVEQENEYLTPDTGTLTGGGFAGTSIAHQLLTHSQFLHTDFLMQPNRSDLFNFVMKYLYDNGYPNGTTLDDSIVNSLNQLLDVFVNNPQLFHDFDFLQDQWNATNYYFQGTPNYYDQRIVHLIKNLFENPTQQNANFTSWAVQFYSQNPTTTLQQFQNWFINGYDNAYRDKLALLTPYEMQNFIAVNKEIDASPYEEEFVKETNEAFVAFASFADIETMTNAEMQSVLTNNCCAGLFIQGLIQEKAKTVAANYLMIRKLYPSWSKGKAFWYAGRETIHLFLDIAGTVPIVGEVCDITNGVIYTIEGDGLNATLSYAGAIPIAGWGATGAKLAIKTVAGGVPLAMIKNVDGFYVVSRNQALFRKVLGLTKGDLRIAHHIIPFALQTNPVIQKAMLSKNAFMINQALNGIPVSSAIHTGSHSNYDNIIRTYLNNWNSANPNASPEQAYNFVMFVIQKAKTAIQNNPNIKINNLTF